MLCPFRNALRPHTPSVRRSWLCLYSSCMGCIYRERRWTKIAKRRSFVLCRGFAQFVTRKLPLSWVHKQHGCVGFDDKGVESTCKCPLTRLRWTRCTQVHMASSHNVSGRCFWVVSQPQPQRSSWRKTDYRLYCLKTTRRLIFYCATFCEQ